jgi:hypothetical protein
MTPADLFLTLHLTPQGRLALAPEAAAPPMDAAVAGRIDRAFAESTRAGLLQLGAAEAGTRFPHRPMTSSRRWLPAGLFRTQAATDLLLLRHREMQFQLLVEIGFAGGRTKEVADPGDEGMKERAHGSVASCGAAALKSGVSRAAARPWDPPAPRARQAPRPLRP